MDRKQWEKESQRIESLPISRLAEAKLKEAAPKADPGREGFAIFSLMSWAREKKLVKVSPQMQEFLEELVIGGPAGAQLLLEQAEQPGEEPERFPDESDPPRLVAGFLWFLLNRALEKEDPPPHLPS